MLPSRPGPIRPISPANSRILATLIRILNGPSYMTDVARGAQNNRPVTSATVIGPERGLPKSATINVTSLSDLSQLTSRVGDVATFDIVARGPIVINTRSLTPQHLVMMSVVETAAQLDFSSPRNAGFRNNYVNLVNGMSRVVDRGQSNVTVNIGQTTYRCDHLYMNAIRIMNAAQRSGRLYDRNGKMNMEVVSDVVKQTSDMFVRVVRGEPVSQPVQAARAGEANDNAVYEGGRTVGNELSAGKTIDGARLMPVGQGSGEKVVVVNQVSGKDQGMVSQGLFHSNARPEMVLTVLGQNAVQVSLSPTMSREAVARVQQMVILLINLFASKTGARDIEVSGRFAPGQALIIKGGSADFGKVCELIQNFGQSRDASEMISNLKGKLPWLLNVVKQLMIAAKGTDRLVYSKLINEIFVQILENLVKKSDAREIIRRDFADVFDQTEAGKAAAQEKKTTAEAMARNRVVQAQAQNDAGKVAPVDRDGRRKRDDRKDGENADMIEIEFNSNFAPDSRWDLPESWEVQGRTFTAEDIREGIIRAVRPTALYSMRQMNLWAGVDPLDNEIKIELRPAEGAILMDSAVSEYVAALFKPLLSFTGKRIYVNGAGLNLCVVIRDVNHEKGTLDIEFPYDALAKEEREASSESIQAIIAFLFAFHNYTVTVRGKEVNLLSRLVNYLSEQGGSGAEILSLFSGERKIAPERVGPVLADIRLASKGAIMRNPSLVLTLKISGEVDEFDSMSARAHRIGPETGKSTVPVATANKYLKQDIDFILGIYSTSSARDKRNYVERLLEILSKHRGQVEAEDIEHIEDLLQGEGITY